MPALVAGIHVFLCFRIQKDVDGRNKSGHDSVAISLYALARTGRSKNAGKCPPSSACAGRDLGAWRGRTSSRRVTGAGVTGVASRRS